VQKQTTLRAWAQGKVPPTEDDGIVSAEEVGGLNLKDTCLVTLSACDTGSGEAAADEGVMGLRRGFFQAGAQNLFMTLWSVEDEETASLMVDFYKAALSSNNAPPGARRCPAKVAVPAARRTRAPGRRHHCRSIRKRPRIAG
jgi:CHAT domain-containing protein